MSRKSEGNCTRKSIVLCISGMAGTGKSTLAKKVAAKYRLKYYSGGDALKTLGSEVGITHPVEGFGKAPKA